MNHIMLRFRPIAPKPAASGESDPAAPSPETGRGPWKREKRKYVRVRGRQCARKKKSPTPPPPESSGDPPPDKSAVTLQLLPERSESEGKICGNNSDRTSSDCGGGGGGEVTEERSGEVMETVIVVERVTDMFAQDEVGIGFTDEEKIYGLERDTCPGFVSDVANSVIWVNGAFKEMVGKEKGFLVRLVVEEDAISRFYPSFACRARVVELRGQGQKWNKIMACDVSRMAFGGFAWKLDVNTALSLSL